MNEIQTLPSVAPTPESTASLLSPTRENPIIRTIQNVAQAIFSLINQVYQSVVGFFFPEFLIPGPDGWLDDRPDLQQWVKDTFGSNYPGQLPRLSVEEVETIQTQLLAIRNGEVTDLDCPDAMTTEELLCLVRDERGQLPMLTSSVMNYYLFEMTRNIDDCTWLTGELMQALRVGEGDLISLAERVSDDTLRAGKLFIPINLTAPAAPGRKASTGDHWSLLKVDCASGRMELYDSSGGHSRQLGTIVRRVAPWLNQVLESRGMETKQWIAANRPCPEQYWGNDCGAFVCRAAHNLLQAHQSGNEVDFDLHQYSVGYARLLLLQRLLPASVENVPESD